MPCRYLYDFVVSHSLYSELQEEKVKSLCMLNGAQLATVLIPIIGCANDLDVSSPILALLTPTQQLDGLVYLMPPDLDIEKMMVSIS